MTAVFWKFIRHTHKLLLNLPVGHIIPKLNDNMNYGTLRSFFMVLNRFSGLSKEIYEERVTKLAQNCALFAKEQQVKLYVELSSAQVYGSSGKMSKVR